MSFLKLKSSTGSRMLPKRSAQLFFAFAWLVLVAAFITGCGTAQASNPDEARPAPRGVQPTSAALPTEAPTEPPPTPLPTRPTFRPGELVDYTAQTGDTLPALAARFNTTIAEIRAANPIIPDDATTMPPGMPMQIPIYFTPFWGSPYQILPDSLFVNGPLQVDFDISTYVSSKAGWFADYSVYAAGANRSGANLVDYVATNFSVSPRLLLALVEYHTGALTQAVPKANLEQYPLGYQIRGREGLYLQLVLAANSLNNSYYEWRAGRLNSFDSPAGREIRPDPWLNAATVALQHNFSQNLSQKDFEKAISPSGFAQTYRELFGDPWRVDTPHIPGSLKQPFLLLPFEAKKTWAYTGGPHTGWGTGAPFAAIDFAPPTDASGCTGSKEWATAVAAGEIVRTGEGIAVLDLDGDQDERTGWVIFYLHLAEKDKSQVGAILEAGQPIGHPSCEGGTSTGSHVHIARKYNGEWITADSSIPFDLEGWVAHAGDAPYLGTLTRFSRTITACECANQASHLARDE